MTNCNDIADSIVFGLIVLGFFGFFWLVIWRMPR